MATTFGLYGCLAQDLAVGGKGGKELVVQVISVSDNDDGGILHRRMANHLAGVENHGEAFAGSLGVPDDPDPPVA